ncbi:HAD family hydrolase [Catellatospora tritici]|uniref:HAD family hydrolase n=1 Tax=Catellatospora tritici TaxID=2851566 RepID=UPI001C2D55B7|nr:HAD family phosphatase [Catellatospora tritici]MBV1853527.1 HAD family phosphatase [Catellatospora tritici]
MSAPLFDSALFDLDGVLIDTQDAIVALWRDLAAGHGLELSERDVDSHVLGCSPEHTVRTVFGGLDPDGRDRVLAAVRAAEPDLAFKPVAGAAELVTGLHAAGVWLGLVTGASAYRAGRVLAELGVRAAFAALVTWGEVEHGKPAPDCYQLGARRLGCEPARCLVFEDAPSGVTAAVRAGAVCVGVGADPRLAASGATWTVPDLAAVRGQPAGQGVVLDLSGEPVATLRAWRPGEAGKETHGR